MPIILTFDDGTKGQFNLIKSGDKFINLVSMEEFYYLPFYPQNRIPYLNLNFTKPL